jgi:tRNA (cytidine/uridine-2'-O-)-methyltransferase
MELAGPDLKIVLLSPEIPGNTGSIGRTCLALNCQLILVGNCGFSLDEKAVKRAGLDYWKYVSLKTYSTWDDFKNCEKPSLDNLFLFTKSGQNNYFHAPFKPGSFLIFGSETRGIDEDIRNEYQARTYFLPLYNKKVRSLNLANAVTAVVYEGLRKIHFE